MYERMKRTKLLFFCAKLQILSVFIIWDDWTQARTSGPVSTRLLFRAVSQISMLASIGKELSSFI